MITVQKVQKPRSNIQSSSSTASGASQAPLNRTITLQGTWNTRQLGGLPTAGGTVRENAVIRTDALMNLSPADVTRLKTFPVKTVIDLRKPSERKNHPPDRYTAPNEVSAPMGANGQTSEADNYRALLLQNTSSIQKIFATLANPQNYPVLYHCENGKDRTGIVTALILMVLGTPRDQIMNDYLLSQHDKPTQQVDASWLKAVFDTVDKAGGIDKFLAARNVTQEQLSSIRRFLSVHPSPDYH